MPQFFLPQFRRSCRRLVKRFDLLKKNMPHARASPRFSRVRSRPPARRLSRSLSEGLNAAEGTSVHTAWALPTRRFRRRRASRPASLPLLRAPRPSAAAPCGSGRSLCSGPVRLLGSGGVLQCCEPRTTRGGSVWWPRRALRQRRFSDCPALRRPPISPPRKRAAAEPSTAASTMRSAWRRPLRRPRSQHAHARHVQRRVLRAGVQRHVLRRARVLVVLPPYVLPHRSCAAAAERPP